MPKKNSKRSARKPRGKDEEVAARQVKALDLRISGKSFRKIAAELKISLGQAYADVEAALSELRALRDEKAERLREIYLERIESIIDGHFVYATESFVVVDKDGLQVDLPPSEKSARVILAALERGAKLQGLDAPERHEHGPATLDEYLAAAYSKRKAQAAK